ncbi:MAG: guanylate kinase [Candidatus Krumholzibacteriota bacterium]
MIVLITGPSGAGKSSFISELMAGDPRLAFSVSTTTRPIRSGEVDGRDYDFVDDETFDRLVAESAFVEWANVHDNKYGTMRSQLVEMTEAGKIPVLDIDVQGGVQVLDQFGPELVSVFLFPPSWDELERRLTSRDTDDPVVIAKRLKTARKEVEYSSRYRYWIVNDDLVEAVGRMRAVITAEGCRSNMMGEAPLAADG